ncbi:DUF2934 domain-containing protein [Azospirillum thermophilum]|uniref:DUF2934 domain-containing protein n=1 Tax=Azospirillum thermophilum TaxID=2202148 RepID=A0A2S2CTA9_9PROT|nr:DUF2934 domain-containing protein [Azospirillum thermophilum]AWK87744.1 DUF2934 domain-containing protein [Azospirillum thermophilum]
MEHILGPNDPRVRARAYDIWEREGRPEGRHLDHWARAAREISAGEGDGYGPDDGIQVPDNASSRSLREAAEALSAADRDASEAPASEAPAPETPAPETPEEKSTARRLEERLW